MSTSHRRVAVVDNEVSVRNAISRLLRASEFEAYTFASGQEFLHSLTLRCTACLLVDLDMPGMSGLELLRALDDVTGRLPAIIMSGHDDPSARAQCFAAGAKAYLCKPFDEKVLLDALIKALDRGDFASIRSHQEVCNSAAELSVHITTICRREDGVRLLTESIGKRLV